MRSTIWYTSPLPFKQSKNLAASLEISDTLATVLARRGYADPDAARAFLAGEGRLYDPFLFPSMESVCQRIKKAISARENICIHGDYDVDGITSTALLLQVLRQLSADVRHHLPNRFKDGYGISSKTVEKIAADGATLLITVDCGIGARPQIELAHGLGMDTIVIDHHKPVEDKLPPGPIISPLLCDYPFKELAGVGLAFKVAQGLMEDSSREPNSLPEALLGQLDLVALGTIADVVPLLDENRTLVKRGLVQMARSRRPGLKALMETAQVNPLKITAGAVAFRMAPRINAAGRLDDPGPALDLLLAEQEPQAAELAQHLTKLNQERQRLENRILAEAEQMVNSWQDDVKSAYGYVLSSSGWHEGVIGIVASKMVEMHGRPVIIIAEGEDQAKGSGRSIPGFNLHDALLGLEHLLLGFGGHSAACGLTIDPAQIEEFRRDFMAVTGNAIPEVDILNHRRHVDALVTGRDLTLGLVQELAMLEPFGMSNPAVYLLATGVQVKNSRKTRDGMHFQCRIDCGGVSANAIGFRQAFLYEKLSEQQSWDLLFRIERNEFNGSVSPQLNICDLVSRREPAAHPPGLCRANCDYACDDRLKGDEFWRLFKPGTVPASSSHAFLENSAAMIEAGESPGADRQDSLNKLAHRLHDRRGHGNIPGQIIRLAATGESIMMLVADVPRRRRLLTGLPLANLNPTYICMAGSRCGQSKLAGGVAAVGKQNAQVILLADFATALASPEMAAAFEHVVFVDPPPLRAVLHAISQAAPSAWLHLFYCSDEVQFTGKVIKHEFDLRDALAKVYKQLKSGKAHPLEEATERLLLTGGKYLRSPALVARCLKVLKELALISVEESGEGPIIFLPDKGKTDLNESETYQTAQAFYQRCLTYLSKSLNEQLI